MNKLKKRLMILGMASTLLFTGCRLEIKKSVSESNDKTIENNEDELYVGGDLASENLAVGFQIYNPIKDVDQYYIMKPTKTFTFDSETYKDVEEFWNDVRDNLHNRFSYEYLRNSDVLIEIRNYGPIDGSDKIIYSICTTTVQHKQNDETVTYIMTSEQYADANLGTSLFGETFTTSKGDKISSWAFNDNGYVVVKDNEDSLVYMFSLPLGEYTEEKLKELEKQYNEKGISISII